MFSRIRVKLLKQLFGIVGFRRSIYQACNLYIDWYRGDGEFDLEHSGEKRVLKHLIPKCSVVFDVGANHGDWTILASEINPKARYVLFEPTEEHFDKL